MGSTYLKLVNDACVQLNEVPLTSQNFATARSVHATIKNSVNNSIRQINSKEIQWPFNRHLFVQTITPAVQQYPLPANYKVIDTNTVYTRPDPSQNVLGRNLRFMDFNEWTMKMRSSDDEITDQLSEHIPEWFYLTDNHHIGFTPTPTIIVDIEYQYWSHPTTLVNFDDTTSIPSVWDHVIEAGTLYYLYIHRENWQLAREANEIFKEGISNMRTVLINNYKYIFDDRTNGVLRF